MSIIYINSYQFAEPTDPYFSNVSLLLHGDGTNGSTTIVDSSPSPKTVTPEGDAQISTAESKFGGASMYFDGTGDSLSATSADFSFGTSDFTIEAWIYTRSSATLGLVATPNQNPGSWVFGLTATTQLRWFGNATTGSVGTNRWAHVAVSRASGTLRLFIDGIQGYSQVDTTSYTQNSIVVATDRSLTYFFNGYMDDLRITKGVARYTSNFTPPTAPFPDS